MQATLFAFAPQKLPLGLITTDPLHDFQTFLNMLVVWAISADNYSKHSLIRHLLIVVGEHYTQQLSVLSMNYCSVNQQLLSIKVLLTETQGASFGFYFLVLGKTFVTWLLYLYI